MGGRERERRVTMPALTKRGSAVFGVGIGIVVGVIIIIGDVWDEEVGFRVGTLLLFG